MLKVTGFCHGIPERKNVFWGDKKKKETLTIAFFTGRRQGETASFVFANVAQERGGKKKAANGFGASGRWPQKKKRDSHSFFSVTLRESERREESVPDQKPVNLGGGKRVGGCSFRTFEGECFFSS